MTSKRTESDEATDPLWQRLHDMASKIIIEEGLEKLSVRRLARDAGTTTMAVYSRFGSKDALLASLVEEGYARLAEALDKVLERDLDPHEAAIEMTRTYRQVALAFPEHYGLMTGIHGGIEQLRGEVRRGAFPSFARLKTVLDQLKERGDLGADPMEAAFALFGMCHGLITLGMAGLGPPGDSEELFIAKMEIVLRGLR